MAEKNIYDQIIEDHRSMETLLGIVERTSGDSSGRRELFPKLHAELLAHAKAEELTFYAELKKHDSTRELAEHALGEHGSAEAIASELMQKEYSNPGWLTRYKTLADEVRHHMSEEESTIFDKAREAVSDSRAKRLKKEFNDAKEEALHAAAE